MTTFLVDLLALAAMAVGATMMFRPRLVRRLWSRVGGAGKSEIAAPEKQGPEKQEAARYALTIFGMMLFAFGLILFAFFTAFALAR